MDSWIPVLASEPEAWSFLGLQVSDWVAAASGLGGAVIGAIIAGVIAARLQTQSARHAYELQTQAAVHAATQAGIERNTIARENAVRLMMRASFIFVDIKAKVDALHRQLENANQEGLTSYPLWARVPGAVGGSRLQIFEVSELSPFLDAGETAVVAKCVELGLQHEVLVESILRYDLVRTKLKDLIPLGALEDGLLFKPENEALLLSLTPYTAELESLIWKIKGRAEAQLERARVVNAMVGQAGVRLFGETFPRVNPTELGEGR